jgi:hypothetical protein
MDESLSKLAAIEAAQEQNCCSTRPPCPTLRLAKALRIMLGDDCFATERERRAAALSALDEA